MIFSHLLPAILHPQSWIRAPGAEYGTCQLLPSCCSTVYIAHVYYTCICSICRIDGSRWKPVQTMGPDTWWGWIQGLLVGVKKGVLRLFDPLKMVHFRYLVGSRGTHGGRNGVHFSHDTPEHHTPTRARAYNDLHKDAVLLKTASKWLQGSRYHPPKMGPFWGSTDDTYRW